MRLPGRLRRAPPKEKGIGAGGSWVFGCDSGGAFAAFCNGANRAGRIVPPHSIHGNRSGLLLHGNDGCADQRRSEEQADDLERENVITHQFAADVFDGKLRQGRFGPLQHAAASEDTRESNEREDRDNNSCPRKAPREVSVIAGSARKENGKNNQDRDRPNVNKYLRKADELRAKLQVSHRKTSK